jgi:hypothetical protein
MRNSALRWCQDPHRPRTCVIKRRNGSNLAAFRGHDISPKEQARFHQIPLLADLSPGGKRPEYVGIVEAPDQKSAEATAVKQFRLTDEERERLVVRTRD